MPCRRRDRRRHDPRDDDGAVRAAPGLRRGDLLRQRRGRARRGGRDRRGCDPRRRARVRAHRRLPPRQLAARVRRRPAARRRARADDDERHARGAAGAGRGGRRARRRAREPLGDRCARGAAGARRARARRGALRRGARRRSRSTTPTRRAGWSTRSPPTCPEWPVGDAAELARASAAAYSSAYGALTDSQSARDLVAADLTDDVRVCAQVDAVDIVALAEPLDGGRARITALAWHARSGSTRRRSAAARRRLARRRRARGASASRSGARTRGPRRPR